MFEDNRHLGRLLQQAFKGVSFMEPEESGMIMAGIDNITDILAGEHNHLFYDHVRFRFREKTSLADIQTAMEEYYSSLPGWRIYFEDPPNPSILLGTISPPYEKVVLQIVGRYEDDDGEESNTFNVGLTSSQ